MKLSAAILGLLGIFCLAAPALAERHALVIGIDNYNDPRLTTLLDRPVADAEAVGAALVAAGYDTDNVDVVTDAGLSEVTAALDSFLDRLDRGDTAVFFFSGHGIEYVDDNWLGTTDARSVPAGLGDSQARSFLRQGWLSLSEIVQALEERGVVAILIINACRTEPLTAGQGVVAMGHEVNNPPQGTYLLFASLPQEPAYVCLSPLGNCGTDQQPYTVFTRHLLPLLGEPNLDIEELGERIEADVVEATAEYFSPPQHPTSYERLEPLRLRAGIYIGPIEDEEPQTVFELNPTAVAVREGARAVPFVVIRSGHLPAETLRVRTPAGEGSENDRDFIALDQALDFDADQTQKTVVVSIIDDTLIEGDETFELIVERAGEAVATSTFTIINDDGEPGLAAADALGITPTSYVLAPQSARVDEGSSATFTVVRTGGLPAETLLVQTYDDGVANRGDYSPMTGTEIVFAAGQQSASISVQTADNNENEPEETFFLRLSRAGSQVATANFVVVDNDEGINLAYISAVVVDTAAAWQAFLSTYGADFGNAYVRLANERRSLIQSEPYPREAPLPTVTVLGRALFPGLAAAGDPVAQYYYAIMLNQGIGVSRDVGAAGQWLQRAVDQGLAQAIYRMGDAFEDGSFGQPQDIRQAVEYYRRAAEAGNASGQRAYGVMHDLGLGGLIEDDAEAVRLYRLAADQQDPFSQSNLGLMYLNGQGGLARDEARAADLFRLGAAQGTAAGQANLAFMYENGRGGLAVNLEEARRLYQLAANQGNSFAEARLAALVRPREPERPARPGCLWSGRVFNLAGSNDYLAVRSGPGTNYSEVGRLYQGNRVEICDYPAQLEFQDYPETSNGFYYIRYNNSYSWVFSSYIDLGGEGTLATVRLLAGYTARISSQDQYSSSGQRLYDVGAILQQDRVNFHVLRRPEAEDQGESLFADSGNRASIPALYQAGLSRSSVSLNLINSAVVNDAPRILVRVYEPIPAGSGSRFLLVCLAENPAPCVLN